MHEYPTPTEFTYRLGDSSGDEYDITVNLGDHTITLVAGGGPHPVTVLSFDLTMRNPNRSLTDLIRTLEACSDMLRDPAGIVLAAKPTEINADTGLPF